MAIGTKFIKIMMPDLMEKMKLPSAYCDKLKEEKSKRAVLKTSKGSWEIKVRRDEDGDIFLEDGWPRFAHSHSLNYCDFLVFQHRGNLHFDVVVCDGDTACEKKSVADCRPQNQTKGKAEKKGVESQSMPSFTIEIKPYIANSKSPMVNIPLQFVKANNLESQKSIRVRDPLKRRWVITLVVRHDPHFRVWICGGWSKFYAANHLKIGDKCIFHLNPTSQTRDFDVQIVSSNP